MNHSFNKALSKFEEFVLSYAVIAMALLLIVSVFMRTVLNSSLTFSEEVAQALLILISFFGLEYCARKGRHITMSILFDAVSNKYKKVLMYVISLGSFAMMSYITYIAFMYVFKVQQFGRVTPALQIPMYLVYFVVPLGFLLGAIEYLRTLIMNIKEDDLYITSEIHIPIDVEISTDLNSFIDSMSEGSTEKEGI